MTTTTYDPIAAEVLQNRLVNISLEMATTLIHTSGSPILSEAKDFCTAIFDRKGEHIGFSGYVIAHLGSSLQGVRSVIRDYGDDVHPGDAFILNDPYDAGAIHQGDVAVVSPIFAGGPDGSGAGDPNEDLIGWSFSNAHILDVGGMSPGGWAPVAWDVYGEALRMPPTRIVNRGQFVPELVRLLLANVRLPIVLNDIRSLVAANNVAQMRIAALVAEYGLEEYERYVEVNKALCEQVVRRRLSAIPDGTYEAYDWAEYDGHGADSVYRIGCRVVVDGDELVADFSDCDPQSDGFINAGYGAVLGLVSGVLLFSLCYDVPANAGIFRAVKIVLPERGSVLNPVPPAPVSCGHMEGASKAARAMSEAIAKALSLSPDPEVAKRCFCLGVCSWPGNAWVGQSQFGMYTAFAVMDCGSGGMGAQTTIDGLDISSYEFQLGNGIPDVEINEGNYPMLYLWRKLNPGSGGPGFRRGGQGMDFAWTPWRTDGLTGTLENAMSCVPTRGLTGGYPGATNFFKVVRGTGLDKLLNDGGGLPQSPEALGGNEETLLNHITGVPLRAHEVFHQITGGGAGMGDPLLREPDRVAADVANGYVRAEVAERVHGVVLDSNGAVDGPATEARRAEIRRSRLGGEPTRTVAPVDGWRPALRAEATDGGAAISCGHCGQPLAGAGEDWKAAAVLGSHEAAARLAELGCEVRGRREPAFLLYEWHCPGCASLLEVNLYPEGMDPIHDIRVGERPAEPIGQAL
jgi:N-methylhydantoinase B